MSEGRTALNFSSVKADKKEKSENKKNGFRHNLGTSLFTGAVFFCAFISPAYADWFQVGNITANLINPMYSLVNDNLGFMAFAIGGAATFLARGADMYQKAVAFGVGSLGTAAAVKLAQTVLHLG
jgi:hypothetical protein